MSESEKTTQFGTYSDKTLNNLERLYHSKHFKLSSLPLCFADFFQPYPRTSMRRKLCSAYWWRCTLTLQWRRKPIYMVYIDSGRGKTIKFNMRNRL